MIPSLWELFLRAHSLLKSNVQFRSVLRSGLVLGFGGVIKWASPSHSRITRNQKYFFLARGGEGWEVCFSQCSFGTHMVDIDIAVEFDGDDSDVGSGGSAPAHRRHEPRGVEVGVYPPKAHSRNYTPEALLVCLWKSDWGAPTL